MLTSSWSVGHERAETSEGARLRQLRQLSIELAEAIEGLSRPEGLESLSAPAHALYALLRGDAQPNDELLLGVPVEQARIVCVTRGDHARRRRVLATLAELHRVVVTPGPDTDDVVVLVPDLPKRAGEPKSRALAELVAARSAAADPDALVGVSSPVSDHTQLPAALDEARYAAGLAGSGCSFADESWALLSTDRLSLHLSRCLPVDNPIVRLLRHDRSQGTDFARSIGVWLSADCDTSIAAQRLNLHANTLRYRLKRAQELSGLDLRDPGARAVAYLALVCALPQA